MTIRSGWRGDRLIWLACMLLYDSARQVSLQREFRFTAQAKSRQSNGKAANTLMFTRLALHDANVFVRCFGPRSAGTA